MPRVLSPAARNLILSEEGVDQPTAWPGENSGISIGIGYDLSAVTRDEFAADWQASLPGEHFARLAAVIGLKGEAAHKAAPGLKGIVVSRGQGIAVFDIHDVPKYVELTAETFPNSETLPPDAFGALVSLVFNRGTSMAGERRLEMQAILDLCKGYGPVSQATPKRLQAVLLEIGNKLCCMARLWPPGGDLYRRRQNEARLLQSCILTP